MRKFLPRLFTIIVLFVYLFTIIFQNIPFKDIFKSNPVLAEDPSDKTNIILMLADSDIYKGAIKNEIDWYAKEYSQKNFPNTKSLILPLDVDTITAYDIVKIIQNLYFDGQKDAVTDLQGIVLFGDIPLPVISKNGFVMPSIYPYVDIDDPSFVYDSTSKYFQHNGKIGEAEIWHGVINFDSAADYVSYFEKLKKYNDKQNGVGVETEETEDGEDDGACTKKDNSNIVADFLVAIQGIDATASDALQKLAAKFREMGYAAAAHKEALGYVDKVNVNGTLYDVRIFFEGEGWNPAPIPVGSAAVPMGICGLMGGEGKAGGEGANMYFEDFQEAQKSLNEDNIVMYINKMVWAEDISYGRLTNRLVEYMNSHNEDNMNAKMADYSKGLEAGEVAETEGNETTDALFGMDESEASEFKSIQDGYNAGGEWFNGMFVEPLDDKLEENKEETEDTKENVPTKSLKGAVDKYTKNFSTIFGGGYGDKLRTQLETSEKYSWDDTNSALKLVDLKDKLATDFVKSINTAMENMVDDYVDKEKPYMKRRVQHEMRSAGISWYERSPHSDRRKETFYFGFPAKDLENAEDLTILRGTHGNYEDLEMMGGTTSAHIGTASDDAGQGGEGTGRPIIRYSKPGGSFCGGSKAYVNVQCGNESTVYNIPSSGSRYVGEENFLWKPSSESDGNLVILLPEKYPSNCNTTVYCEPPTEDATSAQESGEFQKRYQGDLGEFEDDWEPSETRVLKSVGSSFGFNNNQTQSNRGYSFVNGSCQEDKMTPPTSCNDIEWLDGDICDRNVESGLNVSIAGNKIILEQDITNILEKKPFGDGGTVANPWIIFPKNCKRYGATWERLRPNQQEKLVSAVDGGHIKQLSIIPAEWKPIPGVKYGFLVSGLIRNGTSNEEIRTSIAWMEWGSGEETECGDNSEEKQEGGTDPGFHHYNPEAWKGKGTAVVLCPGSPKMSSCSVNGDKFGYHGLDKGREVFTDHNKKGIGCGGSVTIECTSTDGTVYTNTIGSASCSSMSRGSCEDEPTEEKECASGSENNNTGGESESGSTSCSITVDGESGDYQGNTNGNRPTFRFSKSGSGYCGGGTCSVSVSCDGESETYTIPQASQRHVEGQFVWKPESEKDGKLVVLISSKFADGEEGEGGGEEGEYLIDSKYYEGDCSTAEGDFPLHTTCTSNGKHFSRETVPYWAGRVYGGYSPINVDSDSISGGEEDNGTSKGNLNKVRFTGAGGIAAASHDVCVSTGPIIADGADYKKAWYPVYATEDKDGRLWDLAGTVSLQSCDNDYPLDNNASRSFNDGDGDGAIRPDDGHLCGEDPQAYYSVDAYWNYKSVRLTEYWCNVAMEDSRHYHNHPNTPGEFTDYIKDFDYICPKNRCGIYQRPGGVLAVVRCAVPHDLGPYEDGETDSKGLSRYQKFPCPKIDNAYLYNAWDTRLVHKSPNPIEFNGMELPTLARPVDSVRYINFQGVGGDEVKLVYPDLWQVEVYNGKILKSPDEIALAIEEYLLAMGEDYVKQLEGQLEKAEGYYGSQAVSGRDDISGAAGGKQEISTKENVEDDPDTEEDETENYDEFNEEVEKDGEPTELANKYDMLDFLSNPSGREYEIPEPDFFVKSIGPETIAYLAESLYWMNLGWSDKSKQPNEMKNRDMELDYYYDDFDVNEKVEYMTKHLTSSEPYMVNGVNVKENQINMPDYPAEGYDVGFVGSTGNDSFTSSRNASKDPNTDQPNKDRQSSKFMNEMMEDSDDAESCGVSSDGTVPLWDWPEAISCRLDQTLSKPFEIKNTSECSWSPDDEFAYMDKESLSKVVAANKKVNCDDSVNEVLLISNKESEGKRDNKTDKERYDLYTKVSTDLLIRSSDTFFSDEEYMADITFEGNYEDYDITAYSDGVTCLWMKQDDEYHNLCDGLELDLANNWKYPIAFYNLDTNEGEKEAHKSGDRYLNIKICEKGEEDYCAWKTLILEKTAGDISYIEINPYSDSMIWGGDLPIVIKAYDKDPNIYDDANQVTSVPYTYDVYTEPSLVKVYKGSIDVADINFARDEKVFWLKAPENMVEGVEEFTLNLELSEEWKDMYPNVKEKVSYNFKIYDKQKLEKDEVVFSPSLDEEYHIPGDPYELATETLVDGKSYGIFSYDEEKLVKLNIKPLLPDGTVLNNTLTIQDLNGIFVPGDIKDAETTVLSGDIEQIVTYPKFTQKEQFLIDSDDGLDIWLVPTLRTGIANFKISIPGMDDYYVEYKAYSPGVTDFELSFENSIMHSGDTTIGSIKLLDSLGNVVSKSYEADNEDTYRQDFVGTIALGGGLEFLDGSDLKNFYTFDGKYEFPVKGTEDGYATVAISYFDENGEKISLEKTQEIHIKKSMVSLKDNLNIMYLSLFGSDWYEDVKDISSGSEMNLAVTTMIKDPTTINQYGFILNEDFRITDNIGIFEKIFFEDGDMYLDLGEDEHSPDERIIFQDSMEFDAELIESIDDIPLDDPETMIEFYYLPEGLDDVVVSNSFKDKKLYINGEKYLDIESGWQSSLLNIEYDIIAYEDYGYSAWQLLVEDKLVGRFFIKADLPAEVISAFGMRKLELINKIVKDFDTVDIDNVSEIESKQTNNDRTLYYRSVGSSYVQGTRLLIPVKDNPPATLVDFASGSWKIEMETRFDQRAYEDTGYPTRRTYYKDQLIGYFYLDTNIYVENYNFVSEVVYGEGTTNGMKGVGFYGFDQDDYEFQPYESAEKYSDDNMKIGFVSDFRNITDWAGGATVGEATKKYSSEFVINFGDPLLIKPIEEELTEEQLDEVDIVEEIEDGSPGFLDFDDSLGDKIFTDMTGSIKKVLTIDFNKDGLRDIIIVYNNNAIRLLKKYKGSEPYKDIGDLMIVSEGIKDVFVGDATGDGFEDIFVHLNNNSLRYYENKVGKIDLHGIPVCLDIEGGPDNLQIEQIYPKYIDNDKKIDFVVNDIVGTIKTFYGDTYLSKDVLKCDDDRLDRLKQETVKEYKVKVNPDVKFIDDGYVYWEGLNDQYNKEQLTVEAEDGSSLTPSSPNFIKDMKGAGERSDTLPFDQSEYLDENNDEFAFQSFPSEYGPESEVEDETTEFNFKKATFLEGSDPVTVYKTLEKVEDDGTDEIKPGDEVKVTIHFETNGTGKFTYLEALKGPFSVQKDENDEVPLEFDVEEGDAIISYVESYPKFMFKLENFTGREVSYIAKYEGSSPVNTVLDDETGNIKIYNKSGCSKGYEEYDGNNVTYTDLKQLLEEKVSEIQDNRDDYVEDIIDDAENAEFGDLKNASQSVGYNESSTFTLDTAYSADSSGITVSDEELTEQFEDKAAAVEDVLGGLCKGFGFGAGECGNVSVPCNMAFLSPGIQNLCGCPLYKDYGTPVFYYPGTLYVPAPIPVPNMLKNNSDKFYWAGGGVYTSMLRIYLSPTLTQGMGLAICYGSQPAFMEEPESPFGTVMGNCIVVAGNIPLPGCDSSGGDSGYGSPSGDSDNSIEDRMNDLLNIGSCESSPGASGANRYPSSSITMGGGNNYSSSNMYSDMPDGPILDVGGETAIQFDTNAHTVENQEDADILLEAGKPVTLKIQSSNNKGLVKCIVQSWWNRQLEFIISNFTSMTVYVTYPDMDNVTEGFGELFNKLENTDDFLTDTFEDTTSDLKDAMGDFGIGEGADGEAVSEAEKKLSKVTPASKGLKSMGDAISNPFEDLKSYFESIPLVDMQTQTLVVQVPWIGKDEVNRQITYLEGWKTRNEKIVEARKSVGADGSVIAQFEEMVENVNENVDILYKYIDFPKELYQYMHLLDYYLSQIMCIVEKLVNMVIGRLDTNSRRFEKWVDTIILLIGIIETWQILIDFSVDWKTSCGQCKNDNADLHDCILSVFCFDLPVLPIPPFKIPDITIDLSHINLGIDILLPEMKIKPVAIDLFQLPDLPEVPPISGEVKMKLPEVPLLPEPPELVLDLFELPEVPYIKLPNLPPAPELPELMPTIKVILNILKVIAWYYCIIKNGIGLVSEWDVKSRIEQLTQRRNRVDPFDFLKINFPSLPYKGNDIKIDGYLNFRVKLDQIYELVESFTEDVNSKTNKQIGEIEDMGYEYEDLPDPLEDVDTTIEGEVDLENSYNNDDTKEAAWLENVHRGNMDLAKATKVLNDELSYFIGEFGEDYMKASSIKLRGRAEEVQDTINGDKNVQANKKGVQEIGDIVTEKLQTQRDNLSRIEEMLKDLEEGNTDIADEYQDLIYEEDAPIEKIQLISELVGEKDSTVYETPLFTMDKEYMKILEEAESPKISYLNMNKKILTRLSERIDERLETDSSYMVTKHEVDKTLNLINSELQVETNNKTLNYETGGANKLPPADPTNNIRGLYAKGEETDNYMSIMSNKDKAQEVRENNTYFWEDMNDDSQKDLVWWDNQYLYIKYKGKDELVTGGTYTDLYVYNDTIKSVEDEVDDEGYIKIKGNRYKVWSESHSNSTLEIRGQDYETVRLTWEADQNKDTNAYLIVYSNRVDILGDIEKKYNYSMDIVFDDREYVGGAVLYYDSLLSDTMLPEEAEKYSLFRDVGTTMDIMPVRDFYRLKQHVAILSDIGNTEYWNYFRVYPVKLTKYGDDKYEMENLSMYSNQVVAGSQTMTDDEFPEVSIVLRDYVKEEGDDEAMTGDLVGEGLEIDANVNTRYVLDVEWTDNLGDIRKSYILDEDKNVLCTNCQYYGLEDDEILSSSTPGPKKYYIVGEDYNANVSDMELYIDYAAPSISIEDVDTENGRVTTEFGDSMDEPIIKFLRERDGEQDFLENIESQTAFTGTNDDGTEIIASTFETDKKIKFYNDKGDKSNEIGWLDLTNGNIYIDSDYENTVSKVIDFADNELKVNINSENKTLYRFTLPGKELVDTPSIHYGNYSVASIESSQMGEFNNGWCILDVVGNQCAMYISIRGNVFVSDEYKNQFVGVHSYDEDNESIKIDIHQSSTSGKKLFEWSYKMDEVE